MPPRLLVVCVLISLQSAAQTSAVDTAFIAVARQNAKALYTGYIRGQSHLFTGSEYHKYVTVSVEHPYFGDNEWNEGSVTYDGSKYEGVYLLYDILRDGVIIESYNLGTEIELFGGKVSHFTAHGHEFTRIARGVPEGFYDVLYDGKVKFYAKREKTLQKKVKNGKVLTYFAERTFYYILKNGNYYPVRTKKSVLYVLSERQQDLRQFLTKNKIKFDKTRENAIARMAEFYDTPSSQP